MTIDRRRLLVSLAAAGWVAGCGARLQPMGPDIGPAHFEGQDEVIAEDGYHLPLRRWLPAGGTPPRAVILALHAANHHVGGFTDPATFWAQLGIATFAYDQRGYGSSAERGIWPGTATLVDDALSVLALLRGRFPGVPLYLLGESLGGGIAIVTATEPGAPRPDGLILVSPAVWGEQVMGSVEEAAVWVGATFLPEVSFQIGMFDIQSSDNLPMADALKHDPHYILDTRADTVRGLVELMTVAYDRVPMIGERTLAMVGENEQVLAAESVEALLARLPGRAPGRPDGVIEASYAHGWHLLLRDLGRRTPQRDIASWILVPGLAALPSGADRRGAARRRQALAEGYGA
jgi:alpha-beta hydrolase superfamily lysophospholipase